LKEIAYNTIEKGKSPFEKTQKISF